MRSCLAILLISLSIQVFCQSDRPGWIEISYYSWEEQEGEEFDLTIISSRGDTIAHLFKIISFKSDKVEPGHYSAYLYKNDELFRYYGDIEVSPGHETNLFIEIPQYEERSNYGDSSYWDILFNLNTGVLLSIPIEIDEQPVKTFGVFLEFGESNNSERIVGLGYQGGIRVQASTFPSDSLGYIQRPFKHERYFALSATMKGYFSFRLLDSKLNYDYDRSALFLDLGLLYDAPILYRHVTVSDKEKTLNKWIHKYTDFRPFIRVSIGSVMAVSMEYRLTNFIIAPFPQQPRWTFGLSYSLNQ